MIDRGEPMSVDEFEADDGVHIKDSCASNVTFVSFYTDDALYRNEVRFLLGSLRRLDLSYRILRVPPFKTWEDAIAAKSIFCLEQIGASSICWIDSDAVVRSHPIILEQLSLEPSVDIAGYWFTLTRRAGSR